MVPKEAKRDAYRDAGVDIDLAQGLLARVKEKITSTRRPEVLAPIGGFGGMFQLDLSGYREPVMVTSIDGVGTKLMVAAMMETYDTVGFDIVNHCINDIAVQGAEPLYFMDYLGIGRLRSPLYEQVLGGMADACKAQGVALLGGETAEMPGMYGDDFDLVGCITGIVDRGKLIDGTAIRPGHVLVGLASNGLHTNGYSLARRVLFEQAKYGVDTVPAGMPEPVGVALLKPHVCYWPVIRRALAQGVALHGIAHITGGGWLDNIKRVLPAGTAAVCDVGVLPVPPILQLIERHAAIDPQEMYRVFNMGVGMVVMVPPDQADHVLEAARAASVQAAVCGEIVSGDQSVSLRGL